MSFSSPALLRMNAARVSIASLEATSPALCPPMPSQTAKRLVSGSTRKLSSFSLRRRPTSVWPYDSSIGPFPGGSVWSLEYGLWYEWSTRPHRLLHLAHRTLHPDQHRAGHDVVADVELAHLGVGGDGPHVVVGQ